MFIEIKGKTFKKQYINMKKSDLLSMNTSWMPEDLELYDNQSDFITSIIFTFVKLVIFVVGVIVHRAVYEVLRKLPGRAINQMIHPYMVSAFSILMTISTSMCPCLSDHSSVCPFSVYSSIRVSKN